MRVPGVRRKHLACDQIPALHTPCRPQPLGQPLDIAAPSPKDQHLEAALSVKVDVKRRDDRGVFLVLKLGQALHHLAVAVAVHEAKSSYDGPLAEPPLGGRQPLPHQLREKLRPRAVAEMPDQPVQPLGKGSIQRNAEAGLHDSSHSS